MSRFPEASIACLKRVMLSCTPELCFLAANVDGIKQETGLNDAQIFKWAELFRYRYKTEKEFMDFLSSDGFEKVTRPLIFGCRHKKSYQSQCLITVRRTFVRPLIFGSPGPMVFNRV